MKGKAIKKQPHFTFTGAIATCFCGGIGGISLWTAVFPADVVKSRVQVQGSGAFVPTLQKILREEGLALFLFSFLPLS